MVYPEVMLTPGIGSNYTHSSGNIGCRKVQSRTEQSAVELPSSCGEAGETRHTGFAMDGTRSSGPSPVN